MPFQSISSRTLVAALAATTLIVGGAAFAADQPSGGQQTMPPGHAAMMKDFGKLSTDGARAYQDLTLARLAIFDGRAADAKKYVDDADNGFNKAKGDESVFQQAESTMRSRMVQKSGATGTSDKTAETSSGSGSNDKAASNGSSDGSDVNKPIAWLPVDGAISINEDFTAKPEKAKAVQDANKSLANGDKKGAMEKLKLAEVDTSVTLAVVPLQQTIDDVNQAKQLIDSGKFYEGSQKLRAVQQSTLFTIADMPSTPSNTNASSQAPSATH